MTNVESQALVVAAIDFGTTYSGWAFSFRHEFEKDPTKVSAKHWSGGQLVSLKGPTCVLIKKEGGEPVLKAFGYDAETQYATIVENAQDSEQGKKEEQKYYFFKRFKMMLFGKLTMQKKVMLDDITGKKQLPAMTVFKLAIKYLKDDLLTMSKSRITGGGLGESEVNWVITVPAIWNDVAKQFMREAAVEAGLTTDQVMIALEPEAASLYCRHTPLHRSEGQQSQASLDTLKPGTEYMVLDAGGGTVDITVHRVMPNGELKELHKASGGAWGGTRVDEAYKDFLTSLVTKDLFNKFQEHCMEDYIDLFRNFEVQKRSIHPDKQDRTTFRFPLALSDLFEEAPENNGKTLKDAVKQKYSQSKGGQQAVVLTGDKLRVTADIAQGFFKSTADSIVNHVKELLAHPECKKCSCILMVGGFSECKMIENAVKKAFPKINVNVPPDAGLAVLKGAVIYGHNPKTVAERVCKYTYGLSTQLPFEEGFHPESKKVTVNGVVRCKDSFSIHVRAGQSVKLGEAQSNNKYNPVSDTQTSMKFPLYATSERNPACVTDEGCMKIGEFTVPVPNTEGGVKRNVFVRMIFGGTEIQVEGYDETNKSTTKANIDFLG